MEGWREGGREGWREGGMEGGMDGRMDEWLKHELARQTSERPATLCVCVLALRFPTAWCDQTCVDSFQKSLKAQF